MLAGQANFAVDLIQETGALNASTIISPLSIIFVLDMVLFGARNTTASELQQVIGGQGTFDLETQEMSTLIETEDIHNYYSTLFKKHAYFSNGGLKLANKVYFNDAIDISLIYKYDVIKHYRTLPLRALNFGNKLLAAKEINEFVTRSTNDKVRHLINPEMLDKETSMLLISAMYFKTKWQHNFVTIDEQNFYSSPDMVKKIEPIQVTAKFRHYSSRNYESVQLPLENENFHMFVILPKQRFGLTTIMQKLNLLEVLNNTIEAKKISMKVVIPTIKTETLLNLKDVLKRSEIVDSFDEEKADFSGITDINKRPLFISELIHKAAIEITQKDLDATNTSKSVLDSYERDTKFVADHPFLYLIADKEKNIYFIGTFSG